VKTITDAMVLQFHGDLWAAAELKHGDAFKVPREESSRISEAVRALYVLQAWQKQGGSVGAIKFLHTYSVADDAIKYVAERYLDKEYVVESNDKTPKRADRWRAVEDWAKQHFLEETTTEDMVGLSGFSYPTVQNYMKTSPYFRKIKRGVWEVRDPKADRAREKNG